MAHVIGILVFVAVLAILQCRGSAAPSTQGHQNFFLVQNPTDDKYMAIIKYWDEETNAYKCNIFTDPEVVDGLKELVKDGKIKLLSEEEMKKVRIECDPSMRHKIWEAEKQNEESRALTIFPGTKWCGAGDEAANDNDLGAEEGTDKCCRAHDKCDDIMEAGETKHNLTNSSPFTSLSCKCDNEFYDCLKQEDTMTSSAVGYSYFTFLRRQCYEEDYPLTDKCTKYYTFLEVACVEYARDETKPKVYHWVAAKYY